MPFLMQFADYFINFYHIHVNKILKIKILKNIKKKRKSKKKNL
jgi:hypothetical protein